MVDLIVGSLVIILGIIISFIGMVSKIKSYGKRYIISITDENINKKKLDVAIVLGAGIRPDGNPCDLLADRISTGAEVYIKDIANSVLLTGDNSGEHYNEVKAMKNWINKNYPEVRSEDILLDDFGFSTFESIYRAKRDLNIKSAIICTNRYHLPRALYIARKLGIEAYGIPSDLRDYDRMKKYKKREILAQIKDFILANI